MWLQSDSVLPRIGTALLLLVGCLGHALAADTNTYIRIENRSAFDFNDVVGGNKKFGHIKKGEANEYQVFEYGAYRYTYVRLRAGTNDLVLQPIDYVGERKLGPGRFSYVLTVSAYYSLQVERLKDEEPPHGTMVIQPFGSSKGRVPNVRARNDSSVTFENVRFPPAKLGPLKPGQETAYSDQYSPYLPNYIGVDFTQSLPMSRLPKNSERNYMGWHFEGAIGETHGGWYTCTLQVKTNIYLGLSLGR